MGDEIAWPWGPQWYWPSSWETGVSRALLAKASLYARRQDRGREHHHQDDAQKREEAVSIWAWSAAAHDRHLGPASLAIAVNRALRLCHALDSTAPSMNFARPGKELDELLSWRRLPRLAIAVLVQVAPELPVQQLTMLMNHENTSAREKMTALNHIVARAVSTGAASGRLMELQVECCPEVGMYAAWALACHRAVNSLPPQTRATARRLAETSKRAGARASSAAEIALVLADDWHCAPADVLEAGCALA